MEKNKEKAADSGNQQQQCGDGQQPRLPNSSDSIDRISEEQQSQEPNNRSRPMLWIIRRCWQAIKRWWWFFRRDYLDLKFSTITQAFSLSP